MSDQTNINHITQDSHNLLNNLVNKQVISQDACDKANNEVNKLFRYLHSIAHIRGEKYWEAFQLLFGFAEKDTKDKYIPMNAANLCPEPTFFMNAINILNHEYNKNVAQQTRMGNGTRVRQFDAARNALAHGLGCASDDLAIIRNGSEGNNAISGGYRHWNTQDRENVVIWSENHPTNLTAWKLRAEWKRNSPLYEVRDVNDINNEDSDQEVLKKFTDKINAKTRFVTYSETSNGSGYRLSAAVIKGLWQYIEDNKLNCHIHVDGTMAFGASKIDLSHCHSFTSSVHKWFLGPKQAAVLYMHPDKVDNFTPNIYAYDYKIEVESDWRKMPKNARRFELLGQRNDIDIIALFWTQMLWNRLEQIRHNDPYVRVIDLAQELKKQLIDNRWELVTPQNSKNSRGVVRISAPRNSDKPQSKSLATYVYEEFRIAGGGGGENNISKETFRLCPHIYNTMSEIKYIIRAMNKWRAHGQ